jgi:hypothetical protein
MNGTQNPGLPLPRCCAHLVTWHDGPPTAATPAVATRPARTAGTPAPESTTAAEYDECLLPGGRVVRT